MKEVGGALGSQADCDGGCCRHCCDRCRDHRDRGAVAAAARQPVRRWGATGDSASTAPASSKRPGALQHQLNGGADASKLDLPSPVLAAASPRVVPDKAAVAARIRAIKVKAWELLLRLVVEVGTGKVLYAHNATQSYIPASTMKLLPPQPRCRSWDLSTPSRPRWSARAGADHSGWWRGSLPCQEGRR